MKNKDRNTFLKLICVGLLCLTSSLSWAQTNTVDSLITRGDSLRSLYRFDESITAYNLAIQSLPDTLISIDDSLYRNILDEKLTMSGNGKSLCSYVYKPTVVAKKKFSIDDFFLYYPLSDRSWREVPNQLDSTPGPFSKALYAPDESEVIYFSALDNEGIRNIYKTELEDTLWTFPSLLNEQMTSISDEIYPMLSNDGKRLFFASKGLYGVGGYDLYVSEWDEQNGDWAIPVNMGFPYSSPSNDFLYVNSPDGRYSLFASDRDCSADSVWVYVMEYDNMPVRTPVMDPDELLSLSQMKPLSSMEIMKASGDVKSKIPENDDTRRYMDKMAQIQSIRDSIAFCESQLQNFREKYAIADNQEEKHILAAKILNEESQLLLYNEEREESVRELQQIEMSFLLNGVVIDPQALLQEAQREIVAETVDYTFTKNLMGIPINLDIEKPQLQYDYTFRILDTAQIIRDFNIEKEVAYQIQCYTSSQPADVSALKGMSPVFETVSSSGRHIYRVGLFTTYKDVISHLNTVKRLGFKSAYVVGYLDGEEVQVNKVRTEENRRKEDSKEYYRVNIYPAGGVLNSVAMLGIKQQAEGKDIAKDEDGYYVGPFENKSNAIALIEFIEVMGYGEANLKKL